MLIVYGAQRPWEYAKTEKKTNLIPHCLEEMVL